jgi:hypothetical protein
MRMMQQLAGAIVVAFAASAAVAAPVLPADPPGVVQPDEYSFGDAVHSRDWHATVAVLDALEARFGAKSMTILIRNLAADADPTTIRAHYQAALPGWQPMEVGEDPGHQSWSFALVSPDGSRALAIVALHPDDVVSGGIVPMNILTNLEASP